MKLGLIPGAGGTQRLPRLAGIATAVTMCATGEPVSAQRAFEAGILDRVVEGDLLEGAMHSRAKAIPSAARETCQSQQMTRPSQARAKPHRSAARSLRFVRSTRWKPQRDCRSTKAADMNATYSPSALYRSSRVARSQLLRPFPHFTSITATLPIGVSWFHSMQVAAEKRMSGGITFQSSWTYSKFMERVANSATILIRRQRR